MSSRQAEATDRRSFWRCFWESSFAAAAAAVIVLFGMLIFCVVAVCIAMFAGMFVGAEIVPAVNTAMVLTSVCIALLVGTRIYTEQFVRDAPRDDVYVCDGKSLDRSKQASRFKSLPQRATFILVVYLLRPAIIPSLAAMWWTDYSVRTFAGLFATLVIIALIAAVHIRYVEANSGSNNGQVTLLA